MISGKTSKCENSLSGKISGSSNLHGILTVSVKDVPYYEISNNSGGTTIYIAKEVINNGN